MSTKDKITLAELTREQLDELVQKEPLNESAWMQLAECVENRSEVMDCLQQVIKINPKNASAKQKLRQLQRLDQKEVKAKIAQVENYQPSIREVRRSRQKPADTGWGGCLVFSLLDFVLSLILSLIFPSNS